jgi:hypothetical protein
VLYGVLLHPLPYTLSHRLYTFRVVSNQAQERLSFSTNDFMDIREQNRAFADVIGFVPEDFSLTGLAVPEVL